MRALRFTGADRLAIAGWLAGDWSGPMEALEALLELHERLSLDDFATRRDAAGALIVDSPVGFDLGEILEIELTEAALRFLVKVYPGARTAGLFGPSKVRLLRAAKALLPVET